MARPKSKNKGKGRTKSRASSGQTQHLSVADRSKLSIRPLADRRDRLRIAGAVCIILAVGFVAYFNSFDGVYVFDDDTNIVENSRIETLWPLSKTLSGRRPVVDLTLAINRHYATMRDGVPDPWGFHLVNLVIHLAAGLCLLGVVGRTLANDRFGANVRKSGTWIAAVIAVLWVAHPLQTGSVTYMVQRAESMMGLFYLLTLYCAIRGWGSSPGGCRRVWFFTAAACAFLSMGSKGVAVTLPIIVLLYHRTFFAGSLLDQHRKSPGLYIGLYASWLVPVLTGLVKGIFSTNRHGTVGFSYRGITPWEYLATQPGAIVHYLGLSFWPSSLCLDYGWPVAQTVGDVLWSCLIVVPLLVGTVWGLVRRSWIGFVGAWFFVILLPTSSFIPIKDPVFEHRMYLPLAGVLTLGVVAAFGLYQWCESRRFLPSRTLLSVTTVAAATVVGLAAGATVQRNRVYGNRFTMWEDVLQKRPEHARAHLGFGTELYDLERYQEAEGYMARAIELNPKYADAHYNLGNALFKLNRRDEAVTSYEAALRYSSGKAEYHYNLANALKKLGRYEDAVASYTQALIIEPTHRSAHINLGNTFILLKQFEDALASYKHAEEVSPRYAPTHYHVGAALYRLGRFSEALVALNLAEQYGPGKDDVRTLRDRVIAKMNQ